MSNDIHDTSYDTLKVLNYIINNDDNVVTGGTDNYNNSLIVDHDGNYFKQQFVVQFQAVLQ